MVEKFKGCNRKMGKNPRLTDVLKMGKKCTKNSVAYKSLSERDKKLIKALAKKLN